MAFSDGRWLLSRFEWVFACAHPPWVDYMIQIWLKSKMSSISYFPEEFKNTPVRPLTALVHAAFNVR